MKKGGGEVGLFQQIIADKEIDKFSFGVSILYGHSTLLQTIKKLFGVAPAL